MSGLRRLTRRDDVRTAEAQIGRLTGDLSAWQRRIDDLDEAIQRIDDQGDGNSGRQARTASGPTLPRRAPPRRRQDVPDAGQGRVASWLVEAGKDGGLQEA